MSVRTKVILAVCLGLVGVSAVAILLRLRDQEQHVVQRTVVLAHLQFYAEFQAEFKKRSLYGPERGAVFANPTDGRGFPDLYKVKGANDREAETGLIGREWAEATSPDKAYQGYYYIDVVADGNGPLDFTERCGICACPVEADSPTLIADESGAIYEKWLNGARVTVWPDLEGEGWTPVRKGGAWVK